MIQKNQEEKTNNIQVIAERYLENKSQRNFKALYDRISPGIFHLCFNILKEKELAEDALANTFSKIWTKIHQYSPERANFSTWAYNIAKNESLLIVKNNKRYYRGDTITIDHLNFLENSDEAPHEMTQEPEWEFDEKITLEQYYSAVVDELHNLPEIYRDIMIDREINGLKYKEISDKYGIKRRSIATRIRRARAKIQKIFPHLQLKEGI
jgi:RNA polymerase sigma-70 factor, ECF subfamily